jgi:hypothetical protein
VVTRAGGPHAIEVKPVGDGEVRVFGVTDRERPERGWSSTTLGIGGTRAANLLKWDERRVGRQREAGATPDLVVLAYGTNESVDDDQPMSRSTARTCARC